MNGVGTRARCQFMLARTRLGDAGERPAATVCAIMTVFRAQPSPYVSLQRPRIPACEERFGRERLQRLARRVEVSAPPTGGPGLVRSTGLPFLFDVRVRAEKDGLP